MSALLYLKIFIRKRETAYSILVVALLVAVLTSVSSVVNYLNAQVELLAGLSSYSERFVVVNGSSISDSKLDVKLLYQLRSLQRLDSIVLEKYAWVKALFNSTLMEVPVRGVDSVESLLKARGARLNGSLARSMGEAVIGELLANSHSIGIGAEMILTYNAQNFTVTVVGLFRSRTEIDSEVIVPLETIFNLTDERLASLIEFSVKRGANVEETLIEVSRALPEGVRVVQVRQPATFAQQINVQTVNFLGFWSIAVYAVIASASYVAANELVRESKYEISLTKVLGARGKRIFTLILLCTIVVATLSSIIGISIGLVGTQMVSAALSWLTASIRIEPFLEPLQATWISFTTLLSTMIGCLYPAYKAIRVKYAEGL